MSPSTSNSSRSTAPPARRRPSSGAPSLSTGHALHARPLRARREVHSCADPERDTRSERRLLLQARTLRALNICSSRTPLASCSLAYYPRTLYSQEASTTEGAAAAQQQLQIGVGLNAEERAEITNLGSNAGASSQTLYRLPQHRGTGKIPTYLCASYTHSIGVYSRCWVSTKRIANFSWS